MNLTSKIRKTERRPYQICKRCVMELDPWIEFDSKVFAIIAKHILRKGLCQLRQIK